MCKHKRNTDKKTLSDKQCLKLKCTCFNGNLLIVLPFLPAVLWKTHIVDSVVRAHDKPCHNRVERESAIDY